MFFANALLFSQIDTCICERLMYSTKEIFETVIDSVIIRPECNGQPPIHQAVKRRVLKTTGGGRLIQYPCNCKEKKAWKPKEELIPAEYLTITVYDCYGKSKKQPVMVKSESKVVHWNYPPELKKRNN